MSDETHKKPEILIPDELLEKFPPEEREEIRAAILKEFEGEELPGERMIELPAGTTHCPRCGRKLSIAVQNCKLPESGPVDLFDCWPCDVGYVVPTRLQ